jgi:large subunit ribosomal protein L7A
LKIELGRLSKTVGLRQSTKAVKGGLVKKAFIAKDVQHELLDEFMTLCKNNQVEIVYVESQIRLGQLCSIERPATVACIINT